MIPQDKSKHLVLTAENGITVEGIGNSNLSLANFEGKNTQKWQISQIQNNHYKLVELSTYKALDILEDENRIGSHVSAEHTFNSISNNNPQIWDLKANGDGTFSIDTTIPKTAGETDNTGYVSYKVDDPNYYIQIGKKDAQPKYNRFILYSTEIGFK